MQTSDDRRKMERELDQLEQQQRELEIGYEQYFAGVEKREPLRAREQFARKLRRLANRRIVQTDLRFRYQAVASRHQTYGGYWDRILRMMDEGRFVRGGMPGSPLAAPVAGSGDPDLDRLHRELSEAHRTGKLAGKAPDRTKLASFLNQQRERIREKYGAAKLEFRVVIEEGKPKIKVRGKRQEST